MSDSIIDHLLEATGALLRQGVTPRYAYMSDETHKALARELAPGAGLR